MHFPTQVLSLVAAGLALGCAAGSGEPQTGRTYAGLYTHTEVDVPLAYSANVSVNGHLAGNGSMSVLHHIALTKEQGAALQLRLAGTPFIPTPTSLPGTGDGYGRFTFEGTVPVSINAGECPAEPWGDPCRAQLARFCPGIYEARVTVRITLFGEGGRLSSELRHAKRMSVSIRASIQAAVSLLVCTGADLTLESAEVSALISPVEPPPEAPVAQPMDPPAPEMPATPPEDEPASTTPCNPEYDYCGFHPTIAGVVAAMGGSPNDLYDCIDQDADPTNVGGTIARSQTCESNCIDGGSGASDYCEALPPPIQDDTPVTSLPIGDTGDSCAGTTPETWRCANSRIWGHAVSQVCRADTWLTFDTSPSDCSVCGPVYSAGCARRR